MKNRIFQYVAMQAGPDFFCVNVVITIARRNLQQERIQEYLVAGSRI